MKENPSRNDGSVYFIGGKDRGPVKVGFTSGDVLSRLRQLQTGSHEQWTVLGTIQAGPAVEKAVHSLLTPHLVLGEWFEREAALAILARFNEDVLPHKKGDFRERLLFSTDRLLREDEDEQPLEVKVARALISSAALDLLQVNTARRLPFAAWLISQRSREDVIGDLAGECSRDPSFPAVGNLEEYLSHVTGKTVNATITRTVLEAWIQCDLAIAHLKYMDGDEAQAAAT